MSEALRAQLLQTIREIGPCTCKQLASHTGLKSSSLGQQLRLMGDAGLIAKVGMVSGKDVLWAEHHDRAAELLHSFITKPAGVPL